MGLSDYSLFLISQAFSEIGDHLWALGLRNYLFENSPWTPAAGLAAIFIIQAIPVFLFGPWLTQSIRLRWRSIALMADVVRLMVTLGFATFVYVRGQNQSSRDLIYTLLGAQFVLELGTLVFQNCRNCLVPVLYPKEQDISRAHLWANVASLSAAGFVPLLFLLALPTGGKIQIDWLMWAAIIDAITFAISGVALIALKRSHKLNNLQSSPEQSTQSTFSPLALLKQGLETARKYPTVMKILLFSFLYNFFLMGPVEIGLVTFFRRDLNLPPVSLAINLLLFLAGILAGTLLANAVWKTRNAAHLKRFSHSIFWDGVTFFPICLYALLRDKLPHSIFLIGLCVLFFAHYMVVPFVKVSRLAAIQTHTDKRDWSSLLGFHAIAVEGAAAISVVLVAFFLPDLSGSTLLAWGGLGATLCGLLGIFGLVQSSPSVEYSHVHTDSLAQSDKGS